MFEKAQVNSFEEGGDSREPEGFPDLDKILVQADEKVFSLAIDPRDFAEPKGNYSATAVEADLAYVKKREHAFEDSNREGGMLGNKSKEEAMRKVAHGFEAVILQADLNEWFGPDAEMIIPSRYDDIKNGIDGVVEFKKNESYAHLVLAVDMAASNNTQTIERKFIKIIEDIKKGKLATMKYFESERMNVKGEKTNIPRVVIGADRKTVHDLLNMFTEGNNKGIASHYMQMQMLREIEIQLNAFSQIAQQEEQDELVVAYDEAKKTVATIIEEKVASLGKAKVSRMEAEMEKDIAYTFIRNYFSKY